MVLLDPWEEHMGVRSALVDLWDTERTERWEVVLVDVGSSPEAAKGRMAVQALLRHFHNAQWYRDWHTLCLEKAAWCFRRWMTPGSKGWMSRSSTFCEKSVGWTLSRRRLMMNCCWHESILPCWNRRTSRRVLKRGPR